MYPYKYNSGPGVGGTMDTSLLTMAKWFSNLGYSTAAFGKWHNSWPRDHNQNSSFDLHGFQTFEGFYGGGIEKFSGYSKRQTNNWYRNEENVAFNQGYAGFQLTEAATRFIDEHDQKEPFFLWVASDLVHAPLEAPDSLIAEVDQSITDPEARVYDAMRMALDHSFGQIIRTLKENNLYDNTMILFISDNGGTNSLNGNKPFRGSKNTTYEGGLRVPMALRWNDLKLKSYGSQFRYIDVFPTVAGLIDQRIDSLQGIDLSKRISKGKSPKNPPMFIYSLRGDAVRFDDWKLIRSFNRLELYNLVEDPGETKNLVDEYPEIVERGLKLLRQWIRREGIKMSHIPVKTKKEHYESSNSDIYHVTTRVRSTDEFRESLILRAQYGNIRVRHDDILTMELFIKQGSRNNGFGVFPANNSTRGFANIVVDQKGQRVLYEPKKRNKWVMITYGLGNLCPYSFRKLQLLDLRPENQTLDFLIRDVKVIRSDGEVINFVPQKRQGTGISVSETSNQDGIISP
jgi:arylsulfatase A-like enzyme